jgi:hypothetical protein
LKSIKILYIGSLNPNSNSLRRFNTLRSLGHDVSGIDIEPFIYKGPFVKFHHHLNVGPGVNALNRKVWETVAASKPALLYIDNKSFLQPRTLKKIRHQFSGIRIINVITDDPTGKYKYAWRLSLKTASFMDVHFVQRMVNVSELKQYGARRVEICHRSFDPSFHRRLSSEDMGEEYFKTDVGFIGTYESDREEFVAYLIQNGIRVTVVGDGWPQGKYWELIRPHYKGPSVYGDPYIRHINGMKIALHFLRHVNRDEQDSRTFEIPACGTFMLAERSELHEQLFKEDEEAVFFESKEELLDKTVYYLQEEAKRKQIASAGYARCYESGYDHASRIKAVLAAAGFES